MARALAIITFAITGIASVYGASLGINPGDTLNPDGSVSVGLLPGSVPTYSNLGKGATNLQSGNTDKITINTGLGAAGWQGQGAYGATGKGFTQNNLNALTPLGQPTVGSSTNTNPGSGGVGQPQYNPSNTACTVGNCQQTVYTAPNAPEFNLLGDGLIADKGLNSNIWYSASTGATSTTMGQITIPVGIFGVSSIGTMLNTVSGVTTGGNVCSNGAVAGTDGCQANSAAFATISFEFNATDATGQTGTNVYETFALINGVTQRNILDGMSGAYASTLCGASNLLSTSSATSACSYATTDTNGNSYNVGVGNLWNGNVIASGSAPNTVNSTMVLDYQMFPVLNAYQNDYLVSIQITDYGTAATSHEALSAISLNMAAPLDVAAPEPSSIFLALTGIVGLGLMARRRKQTA